MAKPKQVFYHRVNAGNKVHIIKVDMQGTLYAVISNLSFQTVNKMDAKYEDSKEKWDALEAKFPNKVNVFKAE